MDDLLLYLFGAATLTLSVGLFLLAESGEEQTVSLPLQSADDSQRTANSTSRRAA